MNLDEFEDRLTLDDRHAEAARHLAIGQNVTNNGRLFCAMLLAIGLTLFVTRNDPMFLLLAVLATIPVGAAVFVDLIATRWPKAAALLSVLVYCVAGGVFISLLLLG